MTDAELLIKVKSGLMITGNFQDEALGLYIDEVKAFLKNAGVNERIINDPASVGIVIRGVADLWNLGNGGTELSPYFMQRAIQLAAISETSAAVDLISQIYAGTELIGTTLCFKNIDGEIVDSVDLACDNGHKILCSEGTEQPKTQYLQFLNSTVETIDDKTVISPVITHGIDGKDGYTPIKGVDYFDGQDGKDGRDGEDGLPGRDGVDGKDGYTPIKGIDYFDGEPGADGATLEEIAHIFQQGGRNIIRNAGFVNGTNDWVLDETRVRFVVGTSAYGSNQLQLIGLNDESRSYDYAFYQELPIYHLDWRKDYTLSWYVARGVGVVSSGVDVVVEAFDGENWVEQAKYTYPDLTSIPGVWHRHILTFKPLAQANYNKPSRVAVKYAGNANLINFSNFMLEEGTVAQGWFPDPRDFASVNELNNKLDKNGDGVVNGKLNVTNTISESGTPLSNKYANINHIHEKVSVPQVSAGDETTLMGYIDKNCNIPASVYFFIASKSMFSDLPDDQNWGFVEVYTHTTLNYKSVFFKPFVPSIGEFQYVRNLANGTWRSWYKFTGTAVT